MTIAYLNGSFLPLSEARVPALDRGYLFGDGVYEVLPVYQGRPFRLDAHLQRLETSLAGILLSNPHPAGEWRKLLQQLIDLSGGGNLMLYLQVTRGAYPSRSHALPADPKPGVFAYCQALPAITEQIRREGVAAVTATDTRWQLCHIKSIALLANVLLTHQASLQGCHEVLLHRGEEVTEGGSSNVFAVIEGQLVTPPKSHYILAGITRDVLLELAEKHAIPCAERPISLAQLRGAQEIWITSSTRELYPVTRLDGKSVGDGRPGRLWQQMFEWFQPLKASG
ncbi:MAG: D-amino acid aminotransferase [Nevskiales bacterium]